MYNEKEYKAKYYQEHKEHFKELQRIWCDNNREHLNEQQRQYCKNNQEQTNKTKKRYRDTHVEKMKEYAKLYRETHAEEIKEKRDMNKEGKSEYSKQYRMENKEKIAKRKKEYYEENKVAISKRVRKYEKMKMGTDPKYNLNKRISCLMRNSLKGNKEGCHWEDLVGYTLEDLIKRLSSTMPEGCTWQDFLNGDLHIDHIIPKSIFNFTNIKHTDFQRCWELSNLRLLPARENISKSNKLYKPFQPSLAI